MKKRVQLLIVLLSLGCVAFAQVPQFICYQAVATDPSGRELISQNIKMRLTVLKSSTAGSEEWVEMQNVTTDGFGLFDLMIGNGTRTSGAQTVFGNIKWGSDKYFLKVEMDVTGGNNFVLMGTNQLVSVPYALYTNAAAFADSSARAATAVTAQTAGRATSAGRADTATYAINAQNAARATTSGRADTATYAINAQNAVSAQTAVSATSAVNAQNAINATNAMRASTAGRADTATYAGLADSARRAGKATYAINAGKSDTASYAYYADSSRRAYQSQRAVLADSSLRTGVASRALKADTALVAYTSVADHDTDPSNEIQKLLIKDGIITLSNPFTHINDTVNLNNQSFVPLPDFVFPEGASGDAMLLTSNYTVPAGKTFYVTAASSDILLSNNITLVNEPGMAIIPENTFIQSCYCSGLLSPGSIPASGSTPKKYITPVLLDFTSTAYVYTVPMGKTLIIKSGSTSSGRMDFQVDNDNYSFYTRGSPAQRLIFIPMGKTMKKSSTLTPGEKFTVTGYLLNNQF